MASKFAMWPVDSHSNSNKEEEYFLGFYFQGDFDDMFPTLIACSAEGSSDRQFNSIRRVRWSSEEQFYIDSELCFLTEPELKQFRETGRLQYPGNVHLQLLLSFVDEEEESEEMIIAATQGIINRGREMEEAKEETKEARNL